jgi:hypothetical protein
MIALVLSFLDINGILEFLMELLVILGILSAV